MAHQFAIVKFPEEENSPRAIVPMKWVNEEAKTCFFFPNSTPYEKKNSMVVKQVDHGKDWPECPAIVMRKYGKVISIRRLTTVKVCQLVNLTKLPACSSGACFVLSMFYSMQPTNYHLY